MKYKVGDKVKIVANEAGSNNKIGDVGVITKVDYDAAAIEEEYYVEVKGGKDYALWQYETDLELVEAVYTAPTPITYTREDLVRAYELGRQDEHQYIATGELNNELDREFPLPTE